MMRNTDAHLPDDQHYMHYYSNPNPYMPATHCDPLGLPQMPPMEGPPASQAHLHYMHSPTLPSPTTSGTAGGGGGGHKSQQQHHSSKSRNSMNHHHLGSHHQQQQQQAYQHQQTHPMSPLTSMSSMASGVGGGGMLGSPPMIDSSSGLGMNPGSPYMKMSQQQQQQHLPPPSHSPHQLSNSSSSSGHYDTPPPMPRYGPPQAVPMGGSHHHQQLHHQHLHSPSPVELNNNHHGYGGTAGGTAAASASAASTAKYLTTDDSVNISTTLTHVSETGSGSDSSSHQHNYAPTPPQSQQQQQQQMNLSPVNHNGHSNGSNGNGNNNLMASSSQGYSHSMGCNPINSSNNTWNHAMVSSSSQQMVGGAIGATNHHSPNHSTSAFSARGDASHQFNYLNSTSDYHHSITSTPVSSQPPGSQQEPSHYVALMRQKNALIHQLNHSSINNSPANNNQTGGGDTSTSFNVSSLSAKNTGETPKPPSVKQQQQQTSTAALESKNASEGEQAAIFKEPKKGLITAEKRSVVVFKVVEQIIDPSTKNVLKEIVLKNEEVVSSLGQVQFDLLLSRTMAAGTGTDSVCSSHAITTTPSHVGSSGVLGDISGFSATPGNTKSLLSGNNSRSCNTFETSATTTTTKEVVAMEVEEGKPAPVVATAAAETEEQSSSANNDDHKRLNGNDAASSQNGNNDDDDDDDDEEERCRTARALLALHSVNNTPPKVEAPAPAAPATTESGLSSVLTAAAALAKELEGASDTVPAVTTTSTTTSNTSRSQATTAAAAPVSSSRRTTDRNNNDTSSSIITTTITPVISETVPETVQTAQAAPPPPTLGPLKAGLKVMAKWKDKNFYPAELLRQLEPHKWAVKFEDGAARNLFETELLRLELLTAGQEVMLTISGDLCIRAAIKRVIQGGGSGNGSSSRHSSRSIEVELVYAEEEQQKGSEGGTPSTVVSKSRSSATTTGSISKRHKLRDVFLNAEQSSAILARSRPSQGGAVFADVDLDNIVVGKRARKLQGTTTTAEGAAAAAAAAVAAPSAPASAAAAASTSAVSAAAPSTETSSKEAKKRSSSAAAATSEAAAAAAASDTESIASNGGGRSRKRRRMAAAAETKSSPPPPQPSAAAASSSPSAEKEAVAENAAAKVENNDEDEEEMETSSVKSLPLSPQLSARPNLAVKIAPSVVVVKGQKPVFAAAGGSSSSSSSNNNNSGGCSNQYHEKSLVVSPRASRSASMALHMPASELEKILGPVPSKSANDGAEAGTAATPTTTTSSSATGIFEGVCFMLTAGARHRAGGGNGGGNGNGSCTSGRRGSGGGGGSGGSGGESSGSEAQGGQLLWGRGVAERSVPFDKLYLTRQILAGGGTIYDTFEEMKASGEADCVLISDTYHRSVKYIQSLAAGIPIYSHLWIIDSCKAGRLIGDRDAYLLPAGFSIITHSISADKNTFKKSAILFRGMKFYFGSRMAASLEKLWSPVLTAAQSIIVKQDEEMHKNMSRKIVDIIIGDATCREELVTRAKCQRVPLVTSEYIVQCLINGRKLPFESAKCFHYDHTCTSLCEPQ